MARLGREAANWRIGLALALACAALGAFGTWLLMVTPQAEELGPSTKQLTYPITAMEYSDAVAATISSHGPETIEVTARTPGTVTNTSCEAGGSWTSGTEIARVDGVPLVALATKTPFYRRLVVGSYGSDVGELRDELERLKLLKPNVSDGATSAQKIRHDTFDAEVVRALKTLVIGEQADGDRTAPRVTEFDPNRFVWIPQTEAAIATCHLSVGQQFEGGTVAELVVQEATMSINVPPVSLEGKRHVLVESFRFAVDGTGQLTAQDARVLKESDAYKAANLRTDPGEPIQIEAQYALVEPSTAFALPPGAIWGVHGGQGCVADTERVYPVELFSSSLGLTYVSFGNGITPPSEVVLEPVEKPACT